MSRFWKYKLDHVVFWAATVAFHMFTRAEILRVAGPGEFFLEVLVRNGLLAAVIYTNLLILIPRFIRQKKFLGYAGLLVALLFAYALAKNVHDIHLYGEVLGRPGADHFFSNTFYNLSIVVFYVAFSIALQLSREWYDQRELIRKIEIEKLNTELAYLRSQINPHFLFNSINTIYFQIDKKNTDARDTLSTFSDMLRYQLYECNGQEVPIEKEIRYLENYIELQRLRKGENYQIEFRSTENVGGFTIAPLVLICFVENAFKHVSHHAQGNRIHVALDKDENRFRMTVFNTWDGKEKVNDENTGIGLKNVRRRLELLYPNRHLLEIRPSGNDFKVELTLRIS